MQENVFYDNPQQLTKEKLKLELKKHGIELPPGNSLKAVFVDLYKEKVLIPNTSSTSFSADEEKEDLKRESQVQSDIQVRLEKIDSTNMTVDGFNLVDLSDKELGDELKRRGFSIGPVGPTTRKLYEKKLKKALEEYDEAAGGDQPTPRQQQYSDHEEEIEYEEEEEEEKVVVREKLRPTNPSHSPILDKGGSATRRRPLRSQYTPATQQIRKVEPEPEHDDNDEISEEVQSKSTEREILKPERRWLPIWVQILIVFCLVAFIYAVIQTMESNPNPWKEIPDL